jgi:hypothetical protein
MLRVVAQHSGELKLAIFLNTKHLYPTLLRIGVRLCSRAHPIFFGDAHPDLPAWTFEGILETT